jgi:predicted CoA-binding protein
MKVSMIKMSYLTFVNIQRDIRKCCQQLNNVYNARSKQLYMGEDTLNMRKHLRVRDNEGNVSLVYNQCLVDEHTLLCTHK